MCALTCEPRPRMKRPCRERLEVVGLERHRHRVPRQRHRDAGADLNALGPLGGDRAGDERVDLGLHRPPPVIAIALGRARRPAGDVRRGGVSAGVDSHHGRRRCSERSRATAGDGTTSTGRSARWSTACETLPRNADLSPVRPRVPRTTTRASTRSASMRRVSAIVACRRRMLRPGVEARGARRSRHPPQPAHSRSARSRGRSAA